MFIKTKHRNTHHHIISIAVIVGALGYFVDVYDLILFSIIRKSSLTSLGLNPIIDGENILSIQMIGLLIGGIIWGVLGDKRGRLSVLFGSILLYSLANIANGFVQTYNQYAVLRFIAGIGLAGELGASITLVSELVSKEQRGICTSIVASVGLLGAVAAYFMKQSFDWRICYFIGGAMGLVLLVLRVSIFESGMFARLKQSNVQRGNFFMLFSPGERLSRYLKCILIGLPTWFIVGILIGFSDKFGTELKLTEPIDVGKSILAFYIAGCIGDIIIGFLSNAMKSRKKPVYIYFFISAICIFLYFTQSGGSATMMYLICAGLGFGTGFWAIFVTMAAEQFGTNIRATATTTVPNMVRGSLPLIIILFKWLRSVTENNYVMSRWITALICMSIALVALYFKNETFGKDLNFVEA
ncbi:MAG: MFS transporter [Saprospiraceae bacterium]